MIVKAPHLPGLTLSFVILADYNKYLFNKQYLQALLF